MIRVLVALALAALVIAAGPAARAAPNLDPFRAPAAAPALSPFRATAQAAPATSTAPTQTPAAATPPAAAVPCTRDNQCPAATICEENLCKPFERPFNVLLFRKEGGFTAFLPFYWSRRGNPGYRVLAPFYWHFWSPEAGSRVVAPFYWRFEDHLAQRVVTVVPPFSFTSQPDASSWALWPIVYKSSTFGWAAPLLGSFKIADPALAKSYGLFGFLYFWKRNQAAGTAFDLGFPLFVSIRSRGSAFTFALPLNFYWRSGDETNTLALPFFYRFKSPSDGVFVSPFGYSSTATNSTKGAFAWLYWYGRSRSSSYDVGFPLVWSFRSPESSTTVALLFANLRRGPWRFTTLFPVYFAGADDAKRSSWGLVPPVFFWRRAAEDKGLFWLSPLGGYRRDDLAGTRSLTLLFPPVFWRRDREHETDMALFLWWRRKDLASGATTRLVGPYYSSTDPEGSTNVLFPLWWSFRDDAHAGSASTLFPFWFHRQSPAETATAAGVFPLLGYHRRFTDGGRSFGLFPLAFFGSRGERRHAVILPVFFHLKDEHSSATVAAPLFFHLSSPQAQTSSTGVLPLLYFQGHDRERGYKIQFPFFWRLTDDGKHTSTTVAGPVFWLRRPEGVAGGIFPLLFAGAGAQQRHLVLFPLLWHFSDDQRDRHTTVVLNYLHRRQGGEVTDALFPLLHFRRGSRDGGPPETSFTLFPLVHYRHDAHATVFATPVAAWSRTAERQAGFVVPYFWYRSREVAAQGVPPLFFDITRLATGERTRLFGPVFRVDGPGSHAFGVFPLFARYQDPQDSGTWVFPGFFHRRSSDGYALDTLLPLFWRSSWPGHNTLVVGPWFHRTGPDRSVTGLVPLYLTWRNPHSSLFATPLFFHYQNREAQTSRTLVLPVYFRSTWRDGDRTVLFPLWWAGHEAGVAHHVLFPVFWHFADPKQDSEKTLVGPLYFSHYGRQYTRGLMPIAWYSRDRDKDTASSAILPLYYQHSGPAQRTVLTLPFGFRTTPDRSWWYVGPVLHSDTVQSTSTMVLPVLFSHFNKSSEARTTVIPPLLFYRRASPDRALTGLLGLFWRHRDVTSTTTLALPFFYDIDSLHESRTTILLPLLLRHHRQADDTTYWVAPLFYRRSAASDRSTVLFPLLWDFRGKDRSTTLVLPFYVGVNRPTWSAKFIFPNIYYRSGTGPDAGTSRLWVFPLWESAVKRHGDYMWEVLLGLAGWERIGRNRFLKLLFIPFELAPAPAAQTAWYGKPQPASRHKRAQSLSTQVW